MNKKLKNSIESFFKEKAKVDAVFVFGSHAKNRTHKMSDIDIAVLYQEGEEPGVEQNLELQEKLSTLLSCDVDLVVFNRANPILKHQVFKNHIEILNRNPSHLKTVFVRNITEYADLKISRKIIEDSLIKRKIYG